MTVIIKVILFKMDLFRAIKSSGMGGGTKKRLKITNIEH